MDKEELFSVVNSILNKSTEADLEVIIEAIKRRTKGRNTGTFRGVNPEKLARQSAKAINEQMSYSIGGIRKMIQNFAVDVIRKEAPQLSDAQIEELLEAWIPDSGRKREEKSSPLPSDVLLTMVRQFISYSSGTMPPSEQVELEQQIPDWQRVYWERMPESVKSVITLFLKGSMSSDECWQQIYADLDLQ